MSIKLLQGRRNVCVLAHANQLPACHFQDCKAQLVTCLTYVSGATASVQTFTEPVMKL